MRTPVSTITEKNIRKANKWILSSFMVLAITALACANGLNNWQDGQELINFSLPGAETIDHITPDVYMFELLLKFAKNIITLNV